MPSLLHTTTRDRAAVLSEVLLESGSLASAAAALEIARLCDPIAIEDALAAVDRALDRIDEARAEEVRALRRDLLAEAQSRPGEGRRELRALGHGEPAPWEGTPWSEGVPASAPLDLSGAAASRLVGDGSRERTPTTAGNPTLRRLGRELAEELGALGLLRRPLVEQGWGECQPFEDRLLASLDALIALGRPTTTGAGLDVIDAVVAYAVDWPVPDPGRVFAASLVLACSNRHAPLAAQIALARGVDARTFEALCSGVALGSHPGLDAFVRGRLLDETRPALMGVWLDAARRRRAVPVEALDLLGHPDPEVAARAARAAAWVQADEAAPRLLPWLDSASALSVAAATSLAALGAQAGVHHLRAVAERALASDVLRPSDEAAVEVLALLGDRRDDKLFRAALEKDPAVAAAAAWHGSAAALGPLLASMEREASAGRRAAIAASLARMVIPRARAARAGEAEVVAAARALSKDVTASGRLRHGAPHTPRAVLVELTDPRTASGSRPLLALELALLRRRPLPLDVEDWVARQRMGLGQLASERELAEAAR